MKLTVHGRQLFTTAISAPRCERAALFACPHGITQSPRNQLAGTNPGGHRFNQQIRMH